MIDIHSHILPCVDDGSESIANSLKMLSDLCEQGVTDVFLTPHHRFNFDKSPEELSSEFEKFKAVAKAELPINLYLGQEIFVEENIKSLVGENKVLSMNGSEYILLEFSYSQQTDISEIVYELSAMGKKPIIAHVERYSYLTIDDIYDIKNEGGLIQVNADAVISKNRAIKKLIKKLFKEDLIDFVASDYHFERQLCIKEAFELVKKKFGEQMALEVFENNAKNLIKG